jgi:hypothetical protein
MTSWWRNAHHCNQLDSMDAKHAGTLPQRELTTESANGFAKA